MILLLKKILRGGIWLGVGLAAALLALSAGLFSLLHITPEERAEIRARAALKPCQQTEFIRVQLNGVKLQARREWVWSITAADGDSIDARRWCQEPEDIFVDVQLLNLEAPAFLLEQAKRPVPEIIQPYFPIDLQLNANAYVRSTRIAQFESLPQGQPFNADVEIVDRAIAGRTYLVAKNYKAPNGSPFAWECPEFPNRDKADTHSVGCWVLYRILDGKIIVN